MNRALLTVFLSSVAIVTVSSVIACSPAKWRERNASDDLNNASGGPGSPVLSPGGQLGSDAFIQEANANKVDILIVNDNSASMELEQSKMAQRFASFVSRLQGIDYQIAMTTTDLDSPKYNQDGRIMTWTGTTSPVLTSTTPNAANVFAKTISRPETIGCGPRKDCPSGNEQPLKAIIRSLEQHASANQAFFRTGVDLVAVVLTDEDEMSEGGAGATSANDVVTSAAAQLDPASRFEAHALAIIPGDQTCLTAQAAQPSANHTASFATHVAQLTSLTGGSIHSICDTDYAKDLESISGAVRSLLSTFDLKAAPQENSVSVTFKPAFQTTWTVNGNKITFKKAPPAGTRIEVTYRY